jgi:hypothetical protein
MARVQPGFVLGCAAAFFVQEWRVDFLDVDAAVLHRLDGVGDLKEFSGGLLRLGVGARGCEFRGGAR